MYANIRILVILVLTSHQSCFGYYIRNAEESSATKNVGAAKNRNDEWGAFQNTLGLSQEKVELLKSQKDQQGTKELLNRFIKENPKYLSTTNKNTNTKAVKRPGYQFNRLLRALVKNLKNSNRMLKTSFNFELADRPLKPLKRSRRKIAVKMVSDMSSERVDHLIKMFYDKHNIQPSDFYNDRINDSNDDGDYSDPEMTRRTQMDADFDSEYDYDNLYDDERDVALTAKSNQNLEYGSFQDLILQAKRNQWEQESEETKLHIPHNDHFI
ncbi:uncharacterized protein LOC117792264 [Drosophila innubila]|uniref:uncharacterized protein LOC117792264 n=1 Tax=Drosophila innubila TaxID=198719 RepID=UPI00148C5DE4|nr:uncharacterized protein LOC117792264 [Drosophila innubila]